MCNCVKELPEWVSILLVLNFIFGLVLLSRQILTVIGDNLYWRKSILSKSTDENVAYCLIFIPIFTLLAAIPLLNLFILGFSTNSSDIERALDYFKPKVINLLYFLPVFLLLSLFYI